MEYLVSARKWRPKGFEDIVGQRHFVTTIINAINSGRIANAYLFSGTRGVGKTTAARILAKALNCENGPTVKPCNTCVYCIEITQSRSLDVLEIDGASNTHVDNIRELRDNIKFAPSSARNKIFIIDEIHMLSKSAFNALLKTLEEPPSNVYFIFATTEKIKIPDTIISRCQCFDFKRLKEEEIDTQIDKIAKDEGINIETDAINLIAKKAEGSMRDALTFLDQVVSFCGNKSIEGKDVRDVLGIIGQDFLVELINNILNRDVVMVVKAVRHIIENGYDLKVCCGDLMVYIKEKIIECLKASPSYLTKDIVRLDMIFNILLRSDHEMKIVSRPDIVFEMALLRCAMIENYFSLAKTVETSTKGDNKIVNGKDSLVIDNEKKKLQQHVSMIR